MKYKINKGFIVQRLDDRTVIFDGEKSLLYTFNESSTFIFSKLKVGWDKNKIIGALLKKYNVKKDRLEEDFEELILSLKSKKIIS